MNHEDIANRLLARGLPPALVAYAVSLEAHKLPQIVVQPTRAKDLAPWVSKLRGLPYWPKGAEYPCDIDGQPMAMLVQLNFAELPPLPGYPRSGLLQFFISITPDEGPSPHRYGMRIDGGWQHHSESEIAAFCDRRYFRMVYHERVTDNLAALHLETPTLPYGLLPMGREASLSYSLRDSYVQTSDYRFSRVFGTGIDEFEETVLQGDFAVVMQYWKFVEKHIPIVIGGYSRVAQADDPRSIQPNEEWLVLLSIDTTPDNDVYMAWGGGDVANWWIRKEDLIRCDFSNVMYFWD